MKILHIAFSGLGGHGSVFFSMAAADKEREHQLEIIFFGNEEVNTEYVQKAEQNNISWHFVKKRPGFDFASYRSLEKIIKQSKPDILFLHSSSYILPAIKATLFSGRKTRVIVRESHANHLKTKLQWFGLGFSLLVAGKVVFLSTEYRDYIKKRFSLIFSGKRTVVIPNGVNLSVYKPAIKEKSDCIKIGMQSRLTEIKDHKTLIAAMALMMESKTIKPLKLYIAGDGSCRAALQKQALDSGIADSVVFTGMLKETELPAFINSLDIYVHATLGETMSTAIMQVMACRLPIIASDVAGVNNMIIHNKLGLLVPPKNAEALKDAIMQLIKDEDLAMRLAENAYTFATENYSNKKMLQRYNEVFRN
ncbi:MAG: glycosyltransferase family 4 protein [Ferruginibacter sp.]|nr:glycosyltransferase family 4 protein [Ferruginibacter sp.]